MRIQIFISFFYQLKARFGLPSLIVVGPVPATATSLFTFVTLKLMSAVRISWIPTYCCYSLFLSLSLSLFLSVSFSLLSLFLCSSDKPLLLPLFPTSSLPRLFLNLDFSAFSDFLTFFFLHPVPASPTNRTAPCS